MVIPPWGNGAIFLFPYDANELNHSTAPTQLNTNQFFFAKNDLHNVLDALNAIPESDRPLLNIYRPQELADRLLASDSE